MKNQEYKFHTNNIIFSHSQMLRLKDAEAFVGELIKKKVCVDFLRSIFDVHQNFLLSNLENLDENQKDYGVSENICDKYYGKNKEKKMFQIFVDLSFLNQGVEVTFSNSIFCSSRYNNDSNNEFIILPFGKIEYVFGDFLEKIYSLLTSNDDYSSLISLSNKEIKDGEDVKIFMKFFKRKKINFSNSTKNMIDFNIHYSFEKLKKEDKNEMIGYLIKNFPFILFKYFELSNSDVRNIKCCFSSNVTEIIDKINSPINILLRSNFIFVRKSFFENERSYIKYLLKENNIFF